MPDKHYYLVYNQLTDTYEVFLLWDYLSMVICGAEHHKSHIYQEIALFESKEEAEAERIIKMQK